MGSFTFGYALIQAIVLLFVVGILWKNKGWHLHTNTAASILTVVGVLGTFIGIYLGLKEFDPRALQKSIEVLLNGLKLAFLTSIVGIGSALLLKGIISPLAQTFQKRDDPDPIKEVIDKFVSALKGVETFGESNLSTKLETLITDINANSKATQGVLSNIANDLTNVQNTFPQKLDTLTNTISDENKQLRTDRETTRSVLGEIRDNLTDSQGEILNQLETLTKTVSDKNDLIIISQKDEATETRKTLTDMQSKLTDRQNKSFIQLKTLTKTFTYEHNQLRKEFDNFSKNVAESITELATKELISSLTTVIDQFNTQLSTQFGDNFKQLNEAVGKTVKWQEQYRNQMNDLAKQFKIAAASIDNSRDSLKNIENSTSKIADKSSSIVTCADNLKPILFTLNAQLVAFRDLQKQANNAFPLIEKRLDDLTTKFSDVVEKAITDSENSATQLKDQYNQFENVINGLDDFTQKVDGITTGVSDAVVDFQTSMNIHERAVGNFINSVATMESTLDKQLTESITELGNDLAVLSKTFVDDYKPLTQSLRQVLTIAEGILPKPLGN